MLSALQLTAYAYDFKFGKLCYNINSDGISVTVTFQTDPVPNASNSYTNLSGTVAIPETVTYNGSIYSVTSIGDLAFYSCKSISSVTIPNSVTSIGERTFMYCNGLKSINIPNSVTSIGEGAFSMSGLRNVTIGNSVTTIGDMAFIYCYSLTRVSIGNSVTSIGGSAFYGCSSLEGIVIPNSVKSIGPDAFSGCSSLTGELVIPSSVISIGYRAFWNCNGLTGITIPNSVTAIGNNTFEYCSNLTSMTLSGFGAWNYNSSTMDGLSSIINQIKTVNIGSGITYLGDFNFILDVVNCYNEVPPTCSSNTFSSYDGVLHVPTSSLVPYMTAAYWQNFTNFCNDIIDRITLNVSTSHLIQHDEQQLVATVISSVQNDEVVWSSTNEAVATVDVNGLVTATGQGECDILATLASNNAVYTSCHFTVSYPEITSLTLSESDVELNHIGDTITLIATAIPENTGVVPIWSSSDVKVATVDANGMVTARGQGECDITATVLNQSATCHVTVSSAIVITLDQHVLELEINHIATLTPTCSPVETDLTVTSSDQTVAFARIITQNGIQKVQLVGMKQGEAVVTVASVDGKAVPDFCLVNVIRRVGDINADGKVNVSDITALVNMILGVVPKDIVVADINGDGKINVSDVTALVNIILDTSGQNAILDDVNEDSKVNVSDVTTTVNKILGIK